ALALQHEPERRLGVPVLRGILARGQVLDGRPQGGGGVRVAGQARVAEADRAALAAAANRHEVGAARGQRQQVGPAPQVRHRPGLGVERHQALAGQPERGHPGGLEVAVELLQPGLVFGAVKILAVKVVHGVLLPASMSRSAFLTSLPIFVTGNSATISSRSGHLTFATPAVSRPLLIALSPMSRPGSGTTKTQIRSPSSASGAATAATWAIPGIR